MILDPELQGGRVGAVDRVRRVLVFPAGTEIGLEIFQALLKHWIHGPLPDC